MSYFVVNFLVWLFADSSRVIRSYFRHTFWIIDLYRSFIFHFTDININGLTALLNTVRLEDKISSNVPSEVLVVHKVAETVINVDFITAVSN